MSEKSDVEIESSSSVVKVQSDEWDDNSVFGTRGDVAASLAKVLPQDEMARARNEAPEPTFGTPEVSNLSSLVKAPNPPRTKPAPRQKKPRRGEDLDDYESKLDSLITLVSELKTIALTNRTTLNNMSTSITDINGRISTLEAFTTKEVIALGTSVGRVTQSMHTVEKMVDKTGQSVKVLDKNVSKLMAASQGLGDIPLIPRKDPPTQVKDYDDNKSENREGDDDHVTPFIQSDYLKRAEDREETRYRDDDDDLYEDSSEDDEDPNLSMF